MHDFVEIADYPDVRQAARVLGCNPPTKLTVLPRNLDTATTLEELIYDAEAPTVRILWRMSGLSDERFDDLTAPIPHLMEKGFTEWVGPTLFVGFALWSENASLVAIALNIVSDYVSDFFRGIPGDHFAKLDVVTERKDGSFTKVKYRGPVDGLKDLPEIIETIANGSERE